MKTEADILSGPPNFGGSSWKGDHWHWFVEWRLGDRTLKRAEGTAIDAHDVINQQRAVAGLGAIDN